MHFSIFKFGVIAAGAVLLGALTIFSHAFSTGKDPLEDGPRALIAEFLGFWIGGMFLIWSFMVDGKTLQWAFRGVAAIFAIAGIGLWIYFVNTTEVPETPDKEPTGFKSDTTGLHLQ